jgi:sialate O-acetylesterase
MNGENNFEIAGKDKFFKKARVKIIGNKLVVIINEVKNPVAIRYAFTDTSEATLFNKKVYQHHRSELMIGNIKSNKY